MRTIVMLEASVERLVDGIIADGVRQHERTWLKKVIRRSFVSGDEFAHAMSKAPERLVRLRLRLESEAFRRAARLGEPIHEFDAMRTSRDWRDVLVNVDVDETVAMGSVVDWLLSLAEVEPRLLSRLGRMTLWQVAARVVAWHAALAHGSVGDVLQGCEVVDVDSSTGVRAELARPSEDALSDVSRFELNHAQLFERSMATMRSTVWGSRCHQYRADLSVLPPLSPPDKPPEAPLTELVLACCSGRRWDRLLNASALDEESIRMDHCVGWGSYDAPVENGTQWILSLREDEVSLCTVQWLPEARDVAQIKGFGNGRFPVGIVDDVIELVEHLRPAYVNQLDSVRNGLDVDRGGGRVRVVRRGRASGAVEETRNQVALEHGSLASRSEGLVQVLGDFPHLPYLSSEPRPTAKRKTAVAISFGRRRKTATNLSWSPRGRASIDQLRSVARNPDVSEHDRREAESRLRDLMASSQTA